jgi:hypothetical protein
VSKRWRATAVLRGVSPAVDLSPYHVYVVTTATNVAPETVGDLELSFQGGPLAQVFFEGVKSLYREGAGDIRLTWQQTYAPEDLPGLTVGQYVWACVAEDGDPDTEFLAVSSPLRVRA